MSEQLPLEGMVIPEIGNSPLVPLHPDQISYQEKYFLDQIRKGLGRLTLQGDNPLWNDREELGVMASVGFGGNAFGNEFARLLAFTTQEIPGGNTNINDRFSKRHPVADLNIPRAPMAMIQLSQRYAMENPFVSKAARVKTDFTVKNFHHQTLNKAAKKFYDDFAIEVNLTTQLRKIVWGLYTCGLSPVYWGGEDGGPITWMQVLNPISCHFEEILGKVRLFIKIDQKMIEAVKDPEGNIKPQNKVLYDSMPPYWIEQIKKSIEKGWAQGLIALKEGSYTVVENRYTAYNRMQDTLDGLPLQGAFDALQRYRLLAAGDFAVAWGVKNMLTLISEGDPSKGDPKNYTPADNYRLQRLAAQFTSPDYALTVYCDPTTEVRYIVPPLEVFNPIKYMQVEKEIKEVMNLPSFMWNNDGHGTFGAAVAETQLLVQEVEAIRLLLRSQLFLPLYTRAKQGRPTRGFRDKDIPMPMFDQNALRDQVTWLQNAGEVYSRGAMSLYTYMEINGLDPEYEMEQKKWEHKEYGNTADGVETTNNTPARPLFEPAQGNLNPTRDKGGNEAEGNNNPADGKQTPRNKRPHGK